MLPQTRLLIIALATAGIVASETDTLESLESTYPPNPVQFHIYRDPIEQEAAMYSREILAHLKEQNFDALDRRAHQAREEKQRFANGIWKLHTFYTALPPMKSAPDTVWQERIAQLTAWAEARPASAAAAIALAEVHTAYAAKARPKGQDREAALEAGTPFHDRLDRALHILENARAFADHDPHYWRAAHAVALGLGWPAANLQELYERASAVEPGFSTNDVARLPAVLIRAGGEAGARKVLAAHTAVEANAFSTEVYARLAWQMNELSGNFLEELPFDWERVREGYQSLLKRHPGSIGLLSQYCVLACRARDKDAARKCFAKLAGQADLRSFKTTREYERQSRWANWN